MLGCRRALGPAHSGTCTAPSVSTGAVTALAHSSTCIGLLVLFHDVLLTLPRELCACLQKQLAEQTRAPVMGKQRTELALRGHQATAKLSKWWASRPELVHLDKCMEDQKVCGKVSIRFQLTCKVSHWDVFCRSLALSEFATPIHCRPLKHCSGSW